MKSVIRSNSDLQIIQYTGFIPVLQPGRRVSRLPDSLQNFRIQSTVSFYQTIFHNLCIDDSPGLIRFPIDILRLRKIRRHIFPIPPAGRCARICQSQTGMALPPCKPFQLRDFQKLFKRLKRFEQLAHLPVCFSQCPQQINLVPGTDGRIQRNISANQFQSLFRLAFHAQKIRLFSRGSDLEVPIADPCRIVFRFFQPFSRKPEIS